MRRYLLLCLLLLPLFASPQQTRIEEQTITHTQAQQWGLTDSEWQHYQQLRQGERGIWSPGLDPLTALGVEANSDAERQRYAELLARKEHQRVEKELAFQRAYSQAWKRLPDADAHPQRRPATSGAVRQRKMPGLRDAGAEAYQRRPSAGYLAGQQP